MESLILFFKGLAIGFSIAAPVGPIALLCIRTTLKQGRMAGFAVGAGAAVADTIYGAIGVLGIVMVMDFITGYSAALRLIGGAFLIYLGVRMMLAEGKPAAIDLPGGKHIELGKNFLSSFFLTMTNPLTIFAFMAIFAGLGMSGIHNYSFALAVIAGIFTGSMLWWLVLSTLVYRFKVKISEQNLHRINLAAGAVIAAFGVVALLLAY